MKIVIERKWWMVHRMPMLGLNPFGWKDLKTVGAAGGTIYVSGYNRPADGGQGVFRFVRITRGNENE